MPILRGLILALPFFALACRDPDEIYRQYSTVAEAVTAGEQERGWLPTWVPRAAVNLHIQGDLDTNERWIRFELKPQAAEEFKQQLRAVDLSSVQVSTPSAARWWFEGFIQQQPANDNGLHADVFRGTGSPVDDRAVIAFDRLTSTVYLWWLPSTH